MARWILKCVILNTADIHENIQKKIPNCAPRLDKSAVIYLGLFIRFIISLICKSIFSS